MCIVCSKSSPVSSSRPGNKARTIAFSAGRNAEARRGNMNFSNKDRKIGLIASDANERVGDRPGR